MKKGDFILIFICLLIGAVFLFFPKKSGERAEIYLNGEKVKTVSLKENSLFTVGNVSVVVENGKIFVENSPCADKICMHTGKIYRAGDTIACLPEKVIIKIIGSNAPDGVTG